VRTDVNAGDCICGHRQRVCAGREKKEEDILYNIYVITSVVKLIVHSPVGKLI